MASTRSVAQLLLELLAGLSFGLAFLLLQLGLLVALLRFRLYDAEAVISRSANFALITLGVAAVFAATADGLKQIILNYYGNSGSTAPVVFAAAIATVVISPLQERIQRWSEKRFQRNLVKLRDDLPECVRELRESASIGELLDEVLSRIEEGTRTTRLSVIVDGRIAGTRGISDDAVEEWLVGIQAFRMPRCPLQRTRQALPDPGASGNRNREGYRLASDRAQARRLGVEQGRAGDACRNRRTDRPGDPHHHSAERAG